MDIAAQPPYPQPRPDAPEIAGHRIDWTGRDVLFGIFWFIGIFLVPQILILPLAFAYGPESQPLYAAAFITGAVAEVGFAAVAASFTFRRYGGSWERLGIAWPTGNAVAWAVGAFVAAFVLSLIYGVLIDVLGLDFLKSDCAEQIPKAVRDERWLLALAAIDVIAFAPPCEELFFRGFVFTGLGRRWGLVIGIVGSAALFAGAHLLYKSFVPILAVGIVFAFAYSRSRNLVSTILAHIAFNSISIALIAAGGCDDTSASLPFAHVLGAVTGRVLG
jgi:membrane protease YdiL (CAAX protease family)